MWKTERTSCPPSARGAACAQLDAVTREAIESARGVIDGDAAVAAWERARGFAVHQAALIVPYYVETNPGFVASARRTIVEVLADLDA